MTQAEQHFQPQVRDTTNGPNLHTYIPRADGSVLIGGIIYVPQSNVATAATTTVGPMPTFGAQPFMVPPGGPAIPTFNVPLIPQNYPYPCYSSNYSY